MIYTINEYQQIVAISIVLFGMFEALLIYNIAKGKRLFYHLFCFALIIGSIQYLFFLNSIDANFVKVSALLLALSIYLFIYLFEGLVAKLNSSRKNI